MVTPQLPPPAPLISGAGDRPRYPPPPAPAHELPRSLRRPTRWADPSARQTRGVGARPRTSDPAGCTVGFAAEVRLFPSILRGRRDARVPGDESRPTLPNLGGAERERDPGSSEPRAVHSRAAALSVRPWAHCNPAEPTRPRIRPRGPARGGCRSPRAPHLRRRRRLAPRPVAAARRRRASSSTPRRAPGTVAGRRPRSSPPSPRGSCPWSPEAQQQRRRGRAARGGRGPRSRPRHRAGRRPRLGGRTSARAPRRRG
mmetsp:Transcript_8104/g.19399  ORF Transcript_8104/g.19399 Transcript_8104/m.19399 type:complete len:257 (+) Transcript_8104:2164-2934(+)